jgi:YfiR/HmsC-like
MKLKSVHKQLLLYLSLLSYLCIAQAEIGTEQEVKANYIYGFAKTIVLPSAQQGKLTICLLGDNALQTQLEKMREKNAAEVKRINNLNESEHCQVLVLTPENDGQMEQWLTQLHNKPILTISERTNSLRAGVMVELVTHSDRVAFKINRKMLTESLMSLSAAVLRLAEEVI